MSAFIRRITKRIDYIDETSQPVNTEGARPQSGVIEKRLDELNGVIEAVTQFNYGAILDALKNSNGEGIDDKKLLLEGMVKFMSTAKNTGISQKVQKALLDILYKDLPHPPSNYLAPYPLEVKYQPVPQGRIKYAYRTADGSFNNPLVPTLGMARTPYARSVPSANASPKASLPDPGLVFDALLKRDGFEGHPGGISSLFFAFADLVIHSIFNTNHDDWTINDSSSYLDLSILYGSNQKQQDSVRKRDGSGKLHDDVFADPRLLMMPPATCALLVLLNRNHNYIAQRLFDINENGNFKAHPDDANKMIQDDELFHRSRLVNCGYFMKIILGDYVGAILGLVKDESDWRLDPLMAMRESDHEFSPTGQGNAVSIEFNLLYRWHAALSERDTEWTAKSFSRAFPGKDLSKITISDFKEAVGGRFSNLGPPTGWKFGGLERHGEAKRFKDDELANILHNATEARAGAFKACGIPESLRVIEILGIMQSRNWSACSLNEFRKFLGLKRIKFVNLGGSLVPDHSPLAYASFKEWNQTEKIYTAAAALYRDIDNLELYVGLQAEEPKKPGPGAGLCPGYTISRAILADAVALTRGDRYMTTEFNPYNLTPWGYQYCQYDKGDGSYGGMLTKLLFTTLPQYYPTGSAYAHFPFLDPKYMEQHMTAKSPTLAPKYTWSRPQPEAPIYALDDFGSVKKVLSDPSLYLSPYKDRKFTVVAAALAMQRGSMMPRAEKRKTLSLSFSNKEAKEYRRRLREEEAVITTVEESKGKLTAGTTVIYESIFPKPPTGTANYFAQKTQALITAKSFALITGNLRNIDIVKDVINLLPVHWISHILGLPLKSESNPQGVWIEQETYEKLANVARYVYLNFSPVDDWKLRESAQATAKEIIDIIEAHVEPSITDWLNHWGISDSYGHEFLQKLWQDTSARKHSPREFAAQVFAAVVPTVALYSQFVAQVVNFYLDASRNAEREEIVKLVAADNKDASARVMAYVYEALRVDPPLPGVFRTAAKDEVLDSVTMQAGSHIFASLTNANRDASLFGQNAAAPDTARAAAKSGLIDFGANGLLTSEFFDLTVPPTVGAILGLRGLERGPGMSGKFNSFKEDMYGTQATQYISLRGLVSPWADSLIVQYSSA